jgi:hypothetical protein
MDGSSTHVHFMKLDVLEDEDVVYLVGKRRSIISKTGV